IACLLALAAAAIRSTRAPASPLAENSSYAAFNSRRLVSVASGGITRSIRNQPPGFICYAETNQLDSRHDLAGRRQPNRKGSTMKTINQQPIDGEFVQQRMRPITTTDGTEIFFKDW